MKRFSELWLAIREDAHFAYKSLARVPTYTATVVLTLALAIGGLTAVFSVLYAVVLRPLPFPHAHDIVAVHGHFDVVRFGNATRLRPTSFSTSRTRITAFRKSPPITSGSINHDGTRRSGARGQADFASAPNSSVCSEFRRRSAVISRRGRTKPEPRRS